MTYKQRERILGMKNGFKKTCLALLCSASVFLTACNDSNDDQGYIPQPESVFIAEQAYTKDVIADASAIKVMRYKMPNVQGKLAEATSTVIYPNTPQPKDGWRVVVWEHGTVGSGDACAPSVNSFNPRFKAMAESLLAKGYVIVAPDYEGLGSQGIHPYLHLESAAQSAIYAVKAFKEQQGNKFNGAWVSVGQSQGGHASLATAEIAGKDPNYKAAVAAAPASSLGYIIGSVAPQALNQLVLGEAAGVVQVGSARAVYSELLAYAAYVAVGIKAYEPNFAYQDIFIGSAKDVVPKAEGTTGENGLCLSELMDEFGQDIDLYLAANPGKTVADYPGLIPKFDENPSVAKFLNENQPATKKIDVPLMIIQGEKDMAVPYQVTDLLQKGLKAKGTDVTFLLVEGASHTAAIVEKNAELVAFIEKHMPAK